MIISPLAKVMGLQLKSSMQNPLFVQHKERDYWHRKDIQHDRIVNIKHTTYYFSIFCVLGYNL